MAKLSDEEVKAICEAELEGSAGGESEGDLASEREKALDRYLGKPYGDEVEGQSQVCTREIMETVEWIMPSLMRVFTDTENMVTFEPVGPEDELAAEQETDACNHVYWKKNYGFYNTYTFCKDALLSKNGVLKVYWEDYGSEEREEYEALTEQEIGVLMQDPTVERTILELEASDEKPGAFEVVFSTRQKGKICIEPVAPEHFGISRSASSPYVRQARMCWDRVETTKSNLIEAGYDREKVMSIPASTVGMTKRESTARRHLSDERGVETASHPSLETVWLTHVYIYLDRNDDGIAELLKVCLGTGEETASGSVLLSIEEIDAMEHAAAPPNILTHKFYGLSIADCLQDLQQIKTTLTRQYLNNIYLANNGRTAVNDEYVNVNDLLVSRPGGIVRFQGEGQWNQYIGPIPHNPLPPETMNFMEYLDDQRKKRTGAGEEVGALDQNSLASINPSVAAIAFDASRAKIELIARILAEVGFRTVFERIHELMRKHMDAAMQMKLRGKWVQINPGEWRTRTDMTINVGVGHASKERRVMGLEAIMKAQSETAAAGGMGVLVTPEHLYQSRADYTKAWGLLPDKYWIDPRTVPPKPPAPPSLEQQAQMALAQAALIDANAKREANQVQAMRVQSEREIAQMTAQSDAAVNAAKMQLETLKAEQTRIKGNIEAMGKVSSMELERERSRVELQIAALESVLKNNQADRDREVEVYKAQLAAATTLIGKQAGMQPMGAEDEQAPKPDAEQANLTTQLLQQMLASITDLTVTFAGMQADKSRPVDIARDANGLIVAIGGRPVRRDESGRAVGIG